MKIFHELKEAAETVDLEYRHAAGVDMLVQKGKPPGRRKVNMSPSTSNLAAGRTIQGIPVVPITDVVLLKLTRFRIEDAMCLHDLDEQGLTTSEMEASISPLLQQRMHEVRVRG